MANILAQPAGEEMPHRLTPSTGLLVSASRKTWLLIRSSRTRPSATASAVRVLPSMTPMSPKMSLGARTPQSSGPCRAGRARRCGRGQPRRPPHRRRIFSSPAARSVSHRVFDDPARGLNAIEFRTVHPLKAATASQRGHPHAECTSATAYHHDRQAGGGNLPTLSQLSLLSVQAVIWSPIHAAGGPAAALEAASRRSAAAARSRTCR